MSYTPTVPYADASYGDSYMADRMRTDAWDSASSGDKAKALAQATRAIDNLNFVGSKTDCNQLKQFPRGGDVVVPEAILQATCELALAFLDEVDPNLEIENLSNVEQNVGEFSAKRIADFSLEHIASGIPSIQAWGLLKQFLRSSLNRDIDRS